MSDLLELIVVIICLGVALGIVIFAGAGILVIVATVIRMIRDAMRDYPRKD